jgi:hypothetical protein
MISFSFATFWHSITEYVQNIILTIQTSSFVTNVCFNIIFTYTQCQILAKQTYQHMVTNYPFVEKLFQKIQDYTQRTQIYI